MSKRPSSIQFSEFVCEASLMGVFIIAIGLIVDMTIVYFCGV